MGCESVHIGPLNHKELIRSQTQFTFTYPLPSNSLLILATCGYFAPAAEVQYSVFAFRLKLPSVRDFFRPAALVRLPSSSLYTSKLHFLVASPIQEFKVFLLCLIKPAYRYFKIRVIA